MTDDFEPTEGSVRGYRAVAHEMATDRLRARLRELAPGGDWEFAIEALNVDRLIDDALWPDGERIEVVAHRIAGVPRRPPRKHWTEAEIHRAVREVYGR